MLPRLSPTRVFTSAGGSMLPLLEPGDEVWVRGREARPGDVVVYARFGGRAPSLVVHRLTASGATRGDASDADDPPQRPEDFVGRVVAVRRGETVLHLDSRRGRAWSRFCRAYGGLLSACGGAGPWLWGRLLGLPRFAFRRIAGAR